MTTALADIVIALKGQLVCTEGPLLFRLMPSDKYGVRLGVRGRVKARVGVTSRVRVGRGV